MKILVCPLSRVPELVASHSPGRVVSLLDPGSTFPDLGPEYADRHLRLSFHDVNMPWNHHVPATQHDVAELVSFVSAWDLAEPILFHCRAGISRSTAAAYIAACLVSPDRDEHELAITLRQAAPLARPNEAMIRLADRMMGRGGRMSSAIATTGRDLDWVEVEEGEPFEMPFQLT